MFEIQVSLRYLFLHIKIRKLIVISLPEANFILLILLSFSMQRTNFFFQSWLAEEVNLIILIRLGNSNMHSISHRI